MKKIALLSLAIMASLTMMLGQAKKPTIMVMPSDVYCARHGYTTEWVDENGTKNTVSDIANIFKKSEFLAGRHSFGFGCFV